MNKFQSSSSSSPSLKPPSSIIILNKTRTNYQILDPNTQNQSFLYSFPFQNMENMHYFKLGENAIIQTRSNKNLLKLKSSLNTILTNRVN